MTEAENEAALAEVRELLASLSKQELRELVQWPRRCMSLDPLPDGVQPKVKRKTMAAGR